MNKHLFDYAVFMPASKKYARRAAIRARRRRQPGTPHIEVDPNPYELPDLAAQRGFIPRNQRIEGRNGWDRGQWRTP